MKIKGLNRAIYIAYRNGSKINFTERFKEVKSSLEKALQEYEICIKNHLPISGRKALSVISKATACRYRRKLLDLTNYIPPPKRGAKSWHGHRWSKRPVKIP